MVGDPDEVVYQGTLAGGGPGTALFGRPDFLVRADLLPAPDGEPRPGGMHYEVVDARYVPRAQAGPPRGIPLNAAWAIFEFIHGPLSQDPWRVSKPLHDELEGFRGARRGEYRVVLRIEEEQRVVRVVRVDHRPDIYRPA